MIYTVTFNPALDYVMQIYDLQSGEINRSNDERIYCGGKGINVSVVLKNLGVDSVAMGFQGGFTGKEIIRQLQRRGIETDFLELTAGISRINVKLKGVTETDINGNGPAIRETDFRDLLNKLAKLTKNDILILSGSIPSCLSSNVYERIMDMLKEKNVDIVVDAEKELLIKVLPYHPFLIKPNHHELGAVIGTACTTEEECVACIQKVQEMGARNVLLSRAGDGAVFGAEDGEIYRIQSPRGKVKNSVGAGDSMIAGFLKGIEKSRKDALCYAVAAGSATAFSEDLAEYEKIVEVLNEVTIEKIL